MSATRDIRILIADDESIFREGVRKLIEAEHGFAVVGQTKHGDETIQQVINLRPDVLLLGLSVPRHTGFEILAKLSFLSLFPRTILLTPSTSKFETLQALRLGACGILSKQSTSEMLFKSIRSVMAGDFWISRSTVTDLVETLRGRSTFTSRGPKIVGLSRRELDVIGAVVDGQVNKDIAQNFRISEYTVKHHLTRIFRKLGVSNRVELAIYAVNHDLMELSGTTHS